VRSIELSDKVYCIVIYSSKKLKKEKFSDQKFIFFKKSTITSIDVVTYINLFFFNNWITLFDFPKYIKE